MAYCLYNPVIMNGNDTTDSISKQLLGIKNFTACVDDIRKAALAMEDEPSDPENFGELTSRLEHARAKFPPLYRCNVIDPFIQKLQELGPEGFHQVMQRDPSKEREAGLMMDIAQAILQYGEGYMEKPTAAFQEVVSDLYDGFLSAEDRRVIGAPVTPVIAPLVKWGHSEMGPYTWPVSATRVFKVNAAIVSMPPAHGKGGLLAWTTLAHETAGHDVMSANPGMVEELSEAVRRQLNDQRAKWWRDDRSRYGRAEIADSFVDYWVSRVDEVASDVLGILNMGPTAALGIIAYLKAMNAAWGNKKELRCVRTPQCLDPHPMDLMRAYVAISTVKRLKFLDNRRGWEDTLCAFIAPDEANAKKSAGGSPEVAMHHIQSAKGTADMVADVIINHSFQVLSNHSFAQIQNWAKEDDATTALFGEHVQKLGSIELGHMQGYYAAHVVAGSVLAALRKKNADLGLIFSRMIGILKQMHEKNPSWGPLYVEHPGDLTTMRMYVHLPDVPEKAPQKKAPKKKADK